MRAGRSEPAGPRARAPPAAARPTPPAAARPTTPAAARPPARPPAGPTRRPAHPPARRPRSVLLLEDDVVVRPALFGKLERLLAPAGQGWHAVRVSTWGDFAEADLARGSRRLYRAVERPPDAATLDPADPARHMYYMGTHAVLVQKRTVGALLERMLRVCGAESPDGCAYRVGRAGAPNGSLADGAPFLPYVLRAPELLDRPRWAYDDSDAGRPENGRRLPGRGPLPVEA